MPRGTCVSTSVCVRVCKEEEEGTILFTVDVNGGRKLRLPFLHLPHPHSLKNWVHAELCTTCSVRKLGGPFGLETRLDRPWE